MVFQKKGQTLTLSQIMGLTLLAAIIIIVYLLIRRASTVIIPM